MIAGDEIKISELVEMARKKLVRIEISIEPNGCGGINERMEIEPWEKYEPYCPHGLPIIHTKEVVKE